MKCRENTPACGASVEAFAVEVMTKSISPERIFCSIDRLLAELRAGELVDAHLAAAQLLELGIEDVGGDAVGRRSRLVVGECELALRTRRTSACEQQQGSREHAAEPD